MVGDCFDSLQFLITRLHGMLCQQVIQSCFGHVEKRDARSTRAESGWAGQFVGFSIGGVGIVDHDDRGGFGLFDGIKFGANERVL